MATCRVGSASRIAIVMYLRRVAFNDAQRSDPMCRCGAGVQLLYQESSFAKHEASFANIALVVVAACFVVKKQFVTVRRVSLPATPTPTTTKTCARNVPDLTSSRSSSATANSKRRVSVSAERTGSFDVADPGWCSGTNQGAFIHSCFVFRQKYAT